ncbi:hypothetical protein TNCV_350201 [Trichonephila clavipes]|nr:hypothetical protein TNCV_350201 [Trichonephila clavipes]
MVGQHEGLHLTSAAVDFMKRMADCEVEGAMASPRGIPLERAMSSTGERSSDRMNIRTTESVGTAREADAYRQSRYISLKIMKAN